MKPNFTNGAVFLSGILLLLMIDCKKEAIKTTPIVTIADVTNISANSASCGGEVTSDGGASVTNRGICYSATNSIATISDGNVVSGSGIGSFSGALTGLSAGTTYNVRAYATNSIGTSYSSPSSFKTLSLAPVLTTTAASAITSTTAVSAGTISSDGGSTISVKGICWSTSQNPTTADSKTSEGSGTSNFSSSITGLTPGITYYVRAYATNSIGTSYGNQETFVTLAIAPILTTTTVLPITTTTASSGGNITSNGGSAITVKGVCWSTDINPTIANDKTIDGSGNGSHQSILTGLSVNTTYYVRAYATNSIGTSYGNQLTLVLWMNQPGPQLIDANGNSYNSVKLGAQIWMAENLKTTKFKDGSTIPLATSITIWDALSTPAYCWFNNNEATFKNMYGALYNWYTVDTGNLCPAGWHVPNDTEWSTLVTFLGGDGIAGGKLKEVGTTHWFSPNTGATNESGFNALPAGSCFDGKFAGIGDYGFWWNSTTIPGNNTARSIYYSAELVHKAAYSKNYGFSVRCLKD